MKRLFRFLAAGMLLVCLAGMLPAGSTETAGDALRLIFLNIGKADCTLLLWKDSAFLIDAGYANTYPALTLALRQFGVTRLSGVFLTHCHKDHGDGLIPLARSGFPVDAWYAPSVYDDVNENENAAAIAAGLRGESVRWLRAGDVIRLPDGAAFYVLGPLSFNSENENNNSLVMRFECAAGSVLLTGDMKDDEEQELLEAGVFSPCDVLKAGHHGDNNATGKKLLQAVMPQAAVICTDSREEPDTPAPSVLKRLNNIGAKVYVTQEAQDAYLLILRDHAVTAEDVAWQNVPARVSGISMTIRLSDDLLIVQNRSGGELCLDGYVLYSTKGNETLRLDGLTVPAGGSVAIGSNITSGQVDIRWNEKRVWNQKKRDAAVLYDAYGRVVACTDNGLSE